jgi:hypothetical protein
VVAHLSHREHAVILTPMAHEDHAVRACYTALRMHETA